MRPDKFVSFNFAGDGHNVMWVPIRAEDAMNKKQFQSLILQSDLTASVVGELGKAQATLSYTVYGYMASRELGGLGFQGQWLNDLTHSYPLGNGYRLYSPSLMRFLSQDALSPFDKGGLNAYAYCEGDPVNRSDPTGGTWGGRSNSPPPQQRMVVKPVTNDRFALNFKKIPGRAVRVEPVSAEVVKERSLDESLVSPLPTINKHGEFRQKDGGSQISPVEQPIGPDQWIANHQRAQGSEIGDIERKMILVREQQKREEIVNRVFVFGDVY